MRQFKVFTGSSHPELTALILARLGLPGSPALLRRFSNSEISVEIGESVRDCDVFIVQSGSETVNDHIMELLVMVNACKTASSNRITVILPYFPYNKQSKKKKARGAITAKLLSNMLLVAGVDHIITMDLHSSLITGFFNKPVDNLVGEPVIAKYITENFAANMSDAVIISKNAGGDDSIDGSHSFIDSCFHLKKCGASKVFIIASHGILSGDSIDDFETCDAVDGIIVTNSYPISLEKRARSTKLRIIDISGVLAEAIRRTHNGESISYLFHTAIC